MTQSLLAGAPPRSSSTAAATVLDDEEIEAVYEEFVRRLEAGDASVERDILGRHPACREQLAAMFACHRLLSAGTEPPDFPSAGEVLAGFQLVEELGRGARGRVWLARQTDLADREVVLKLTPLEGAEHLSLARLQHTNIVPVYSAHDDVKRSLRVLCMPYFGRGTLAGALHALKNVPVLRRSGRSFVDLLEAETPADAPPAIAAQTREWLAKLTYTQAVCWLVSRLADALHFAHERGLIHFDVKPSNVLLACDGQPMLLDFHLARGPIDPGGPPPDRLGGTPGYLPPEQASAMRACEFGSPIETAVGAAADVFALGATLQETLSGISPTEGKPAPLASLNPEVSPGLEGIVSKCLAARPENRYATAAALADDLRRHLNHQPLIGAPNRNLVERWRKWRRRKPRAVRAAGAVIVILTAAGILLATWWMQQRDRRQDAERALREGRSLLAAGDAAAAVATLENGLAWLDAASFSNELTAELRRQLDVARRAKLVNQLHELVQQVRPLLGEPLPVDELRPLAVQCEEFWTQREQVASALGAEHNPNAAADLLDLAVCWADVQQRLAADSSAELGRQRALQTLYAAAALLGPSRVLEFQRRLYRGQSADEAIRGLPPAHSAFDYYAVGRALLRADNPSAANRELAAARDLDPAGLWPNFYYGVCAYRLGRHEEAVAAFSVGIGAAPRLAVCYRNRGLAHQALGRPEAAKRDFAQAERLRPSSPTANAAAEGLPIPRDNLP